MIDTSQINTTQITADLAATRLQPTRIIDDPNYIKSCFNEAGRTAQNFLEDYPITGNFSPPMTERDAFYPLQHLPKIIDHKMEQALDRIAKYNSQQQFKKTYKQAKEKYQRELANCKTIFPSGKRSIANRRKYLVPHAMEFLREVVHISQLGESVFKK